MLAAKIDILMKMLEGRATDPTTDTVQAIDSHMNVRTVEMLATWGTIVLKPRKMLHSSTTGFANNNSKVMGVTTKIAPR